MESDACFFQAHGGGHWGRSDPAGEAARARRGLCREELDDEAEGVGGGDNALPQDAAAAASGSGTPKSSDDSQVPQPTLSSSAHPFEVSSRHPDDRRPSLPHPAGGRAVRVVRALMAALSRRSTVSAVNLRAWRDPEGRPRIWQQARSGTRRNRSQPAVIAGPHNEEEANGGACPRPSPPPEPLWARLSAAWPTGFLLNSGRLTPFTPIASSLSLSLSPPVSLLPASFVTVESACGRFRG